MVLIGIILYLRQVLLSILDSDKIIQLGDLNARLRKDHQTWNCLGSHGIGNANSNDILLLQFCNEHALEIRNTWFRQKNKCKGTWQRRRSKYWHMIDFRIFRRLDFQDLHSVRTMRGADCWTDHRLVKVNLAHKIRQKARHTALPRPKQLDVSKSYSSETKSILVNTVNSIELDESNAWKDFYS